MKRIIAGGTPALLILAFAATAHARLGETRAQLEARYGGPGRAATAPLAENGRGWQTDAYIILVGFSNQVSVLEIISKRESLSYLDADERDAFLAANAAGQEWAHDFKIGLDSVYRRKDGQAWALWQKWDGRIMVMADAYYRALGASAVAEKKKQLSPF